MTQDYLFTDWQLPKTDHPDSAIRLAAVVHRFPMPTTASVSFRNAFATVGSAAATRKLLQSADKARETLLEACTSSTVSAQKCTEAAQRYAPLMETILLSCKVQPENARLDEKLLFQYRSAMEGKQAESFTSEALMYDLVLVTATLAWSHAAKATEESAAGEFAAAARQYATAAGVFDYLATDALPKWISKGSSVKETDLPSECHAPLAGALANELMMAHGQQMAIATLLVKSETPNYSLLAKLCLGVHEHLDNFVAILRRDCQTALERMEKDFLTLVALETAVHESLSLYFQARAKWVQDEHGIAIALLSEAGICLQTRDTAASKGVPDVTKNSGLCVLCKELEDLRAHMKSLLQTWEYDNNHVYFSPVPQSIGAGDKLQQGIQMKKKMPYVPAEVEPVLLQLPDRSAVQRSDSDLARELQRRLDAGEE